MNNILSRYDKHAKRYNRPSLVFEAFEGFLMPYAYGVLIGAVIGLIVAVIANVVIWGGYYHG